MQFMIRDSGTLGVLTLRGIFSAAQASELRAYLTRGLNRTNRLIVNCDHTASLDLTCLRLLCTAYRVSRVMNKGFILAGDRAALFRSAKGDAEYARCAETGQQCASGCLWTDGNDGPAGIHDNGDSQSETIDFAA